VPIRDTSAARAAVTSQLFDLFRHYGYAGLSIGDICERTGVGRSSLYHLFPDGKEQMAMAVLDLADAWLTAEVVPALSAPGTTQERIGRMLGFVDRAYDGGCAPCLLASFTRGDAPDALRAGAAACFARWTQAMAATLEASGIADAAEGAAQVLARIAGAVLLSGAHNDPGIFRNALEDLRQFAAELDARARVN
jgi:TetR/AcrR family transcriptional regulator, lmrAB and yxaGH operons repressor